MSANIEGQLAPRERELLTATIRRVALFAMLFPLLALFSSCSKKPVVSPVPVAPAAPQIQNLIQTPTPDSGPDLSTPKKAALAFANALAAGDTAGLGRMVEGTGSRTYTFYLGFSEMVASEHLFATAFKAKFGEDTQLPPEIEQIGNPRSVPTNYDELTEQIDGDTAKLVDTSGHAGVRLKKIDGVWKVDLKAGDDLLSPEAIASQDKMRDQFAATKKGFNQTTAKIFDGELADPKSALDAVKTAIGTQP